MMAMLLLTPVLVAAGLAAVEASHVLALPTLRDLLGRVVSGAAGTIVFHGVNGVVADACDRVALSAALHRAAGPAMQQSLREGVERTKGQLFPDPAARVILAAVDLASDGVG